MGKKKRRLLSPKFANWRKANGIGVKSTPVVEEKTEEAKAPEPEVVLEKKEPVVEKIIEEPKPIEEKPKAKARRKTTTKKATTSTAKKTTTNTRRKRTAKAKPTTTDI